MVKGDRALRVFEEDENVEKLIQRLEYLAVNGLEPEKEFNRETDNRENKR